jgi:hypothetical protein
MASSCRPSARWLNGQAEELAAMVGAFRLDAAHAATEKASRRGALPAPGRSAEKAPRARAVEVRRAPIDDPFPMDQPAALTDF